MEFLPKYIFIFVISLTISWLTVPLLKKLAPSMGLLDQPNERRIHKVPIPRCGGIAVFLALHLSLALIFLGPWGNLMGAIQLQEWEFMLAGSTVLLIVGVIDDRFNICAWMKLLGQIAVAVLMFFGGFTIETFLYLQLPPLIDLGITLFWFLLLINAFNLIDGIDGACAGLGLIASAGLAGMLLSLNQVTDTLVLMALAGACLGFLRHNFHPASIFLGDCGSMLIGFVLAAVSLKTNMKQPMMVALLVPLLAVGVPVFDVIMAVWRRLARKIISRIHNDTLATKIFGPDLDHIHHKLMRSGMTQRKAALILYLFAILACIIALSAVAMSSNRAALLLISMIVVIHIIVRKIAQVELWTTTQIVLQGFHRPKSMICKLAAMAWDIGFLLLATFFVGTVLSPPVDPMLYFSISVTIPFTTLYFYHIYRVVWRRARMTQLFILTLQLLAGEILAGVALIWVSGVPAQDLIFSMLIHGLFSGFGIFGIRATFGLARDMAAWLHGSVSMEGEVKSLILGAGENAILYLRQSAFEEQQKAARKVVGLIDDAPDLLHKTIYGYPVLGTFSELDALIRQWRIGELIFTSHFNNELRAEVLSLKTKYDLMIRDFVYTLRDLDEHGVCQGLVTPNSMTEVSCHNLCKWHSECNKDRRMPAS
ncbi:MAG TPA: hypothetical protein VIR63_03080 [Pontiella sp.]